MLIGRKTLITFILTTSVLMVAPAIAKAQTWSALGATGFSMGAAPFTSMAISRPSETVYVAYQDSFNHHKATVMKYSGGSWSDVGIAGFSSAAVSAIMLKIDDNGYPYVVYTDDGNGYKATVLKFDGITWSSVGSPGFSTGQTDFNSLAIDHAQVPYVAYKDMANGSKATVMKYDASHSAWVTVGSAGFSAGSAFGTSIALDGSGTPYVVYEDYGNGQRATVMKFNGTSWSNIGGSGFSTGAVYNTTIAIDASGTPYVAYGDVANNNRLTVMKFDGTGWAPVGSAGFSLTKNIGYPSLAIDGSGTLYVAFQDSVRATVMKFNGINWVNAGNADFSAGYAGYTSMAINDSGDLYVAYEDGGNSDKATVMTLNAGTNGVKNIAHSLPALIVSPNPNNGLFKIKLSAQTNEPFRIVISNVPGEKITELTMLANSEREIKLDVAPGIYFITAVSSKEIQTAKIIVQ